MTKIKQAVFPLAGAGVRMLPASRATAKPLMTLGDRALLDYALDEALAAGVEHCIFIIGADRLQEEALRRYLSWDAASQNLLQQQGKTAAAALAGALRHTRLSFIRQPRAAGLGDAVLQAKELITDRFAVLLPDDVLAPPVLASMAAAGGERHMIALTKVPAAETSRYGIVRLADGEEGRPAPVLADMVEKPKPEAAPSRWAIIGRYILAPEIFAALADLPAGHHNEIQLTDALRLRLDAEGVQGFLIAGKRYDCGQSAGFAAAWAGFAAGEF